MVAREVVESMESLKEAFTIGTSAAKQHAAAMQEAADASKQAAQAGRVAQSRIGERRFREDAERERTLGLRDLDVALRAAEEGGDSSGARGLRQRGVLRDTTEAQGRLDGLRRRDPATTDAGRLERAAEIEDLTKKLADFGKQSLDFELKNLDVIRQQGKEKIASQEKALDLIKQQKEQLLSSAERFGLQSPAEQRRVLELSRKVAGGGQLSNRDLQFAGQNRDLFAGPLRDAGVRRAEAGGFQEILKNLKLGDLQQTIKAEATLKQEIKIQLEANKEAIAQQLAEKIEPLIDQLAKQLQQRNDATIARRGSEVAILAALGGVQ